MLNYIAQKGGIANAHGLSSPLAQILNPTPTLPCAERTGTREAWGDPKDKVEIIRTPDHKENKIDNVQ